MRTTPAAPDCPALPASGAGLNSHHSDGHSCPAQAPGPAPRSGRLRRTGQGARRSLPPLRRVQPRGATYNLLELPSDGSWGRPSARDRGFDSSLSGRLVPLPRPEGPTPDQRWDVPLEAAPVRWDGGRDRREDDRRIANVRGRRCQKPTRASCRGSSDRGSTYVSPRMLLHRPSGRGWLRICHASSGRLGPLDLVMSSLGGDVGAAR